jgi:hypothetical protein
VYTADASAIQVSIRHISFPLYDPEGSLIDWIDCLTRAAKAEETKVIQKLALEYRELLQLFSCSNLKTFEDWIWKWENYLLKAVRSRC